MNSATATQSEPHTIVPPKYFACLLDISSVCSPDLIERCGGKLYYSGFFDDSVNTYLCSLTPSIFVDVIELVPEISPEDEERSNALNEELLELLSESDSGYYDRRTIDRLRKESPERFQELVHLGLEGETDAERVDEVREFLHGNPVF